MVRRLQGVALAAGVVGVALALLLASGGGGGPRPLPVLGGSAGTMAESAADADLASMRAGGISYEVDGELPDLDGEARAWVTRKGDPTGRLAALMDALGVGGTVERTDFGWRVTDGDARLEVNDVPGLPWSFWREMGEPVVQDGGGTSGSAGSGESSVLHPDETVSSDGTRPVPEPANEPVEEPVEEPRRPANLPSADASRGIAEPVIRAAGVDLDTAAVRVEDGFSVWVVSAEPVVGGLPTMGYGTTVSVGPEGRIDWAGGWLAAAEGGDEYPLIGTDAALARLQEQAGPQILLDDATGAEPAATVEGAPERDTMIAPADCPPDADCPEPEPIVVRVTGVRLGLLFMPFYEGDEAWLVPAYLFELDGGQGGEMPIVAVPDEHVVQPPAVDPMPVEDVPDDRGGAEPGQSEPGYPGPDGATIESRPVEE